MNRQCIFNYRKFKNSLLYQEYKFIRGLMILPKRFFFSFFFVIEIFLFNSFYKRLFSPNSFFFLKKSIIKKIYIIEVIEILILHSRILTNLFFKKFFKIKKIF